LGLSELPFPEYATSRGVDSEVDVDVDSEGDDGGEENGGALGPPPPLGATLVIMTGVSVEETGL
jgi:hypothetical protein